MYFTSSGSVAWSLAKEQEQKISKSRKKRKDEMTCQYSFVDPSIRYSLIYVSIKKYQEEDLRRVFDKVRVSLGFKKFSK
jgi:hypothetical protein